VRSAGGGAEPAEDHDGTLRRVVAAAGSINTNKVEYCFWEKSNESKKNPVHTKPSHVVLVLDIQGPNVRHTEIFAGIALQRLLALVL